MTLEELEKLRELLRKFWLASAVPNLVAAVENDVAQQILLRKAGR